MKSCTINGCEKKYRTKGYCSMHYTRFSKYGDPNVALKTPHGEQLDFFYKAIKIETDECIEWPYPKRPSGYAYVYYKGKPVGVHRLALKLSKGEPLEGKQLALHTAGICHNRACFNPRHLRWGSSKENQMDRVLDGTRNRGVSHPTAKLTEAQVLAIRADSRIYKIISAEYSIGVATVGRIKNKRLWQHI